MSKNSHRSSELKPLLALTSIEQSQAIRVLEKLPTLNKGRLFHVGNLDDPNQSHGDLEGPLLSVSTHPEAWRQIAQLQSPLIWSIQKEDKSPFILIDALRCRWEKKKPHIEWALSMGLILETQKYQALIEKKDGSYTPMVADSLQEAVLAHEAQGAPKPIATLTMNEELQRFWDQRKYSPWSMPSAYQIETAILAALVVCANKEPIKKLKSSCKIPQGIWWEENLEPQNHTAPRGGLCPNNLESLELIK